MNKHNRLWANWDALAPTWRQTVFQYSHRVTKPMSFNKSQIIKTKFYYNNTTNHGNVNNPCNDGVITWKRFSLYYLFLKGSHLLPVDFPYKWPVLLTGVFHPQAASNMDPWWHLSKELIQVVESISPWFEPQWRSCDLIMVGVFIKIGHQQPPCSIRYRQCTYYDSIQSDLNKVLHTTFSNACYWTKMLTFLLKLHRSYLVGVQITWIPH